MSNADAIIAALRSGNDSLAGLVSGYSDEQLAGPTGADEWDVSQVLSHLGSGAEITRPASRPPLKASRTPAWSSTRPSGRATTGPAAASG